MLFRIVPREAILQSAAFYFVGDLNCAEEHSTDTSNPRSGRSPHHSLWMLHCWAKYLLAAESLGYGGLSGWST